jgi:polysaccharide chain length determinant protein (PEP-CTERM system associated)
MLNENNSNLMKYYEIFLRNRRLFFVPFMAVFCLTFLSSLFFPKVYESSTILRVLKSQPNPIGGGRRDNNQELQVLLKTVEGMVLSRPNLVALVKKLNLDSDIKNKALLEDLINVIRDHVTIKRMGPELFTVSYQDGDPQKAMLIDSTIVNLLLEQSISLKRDAALSSVDFIESQLDIYKKKLEGSEEALRVFKQEHIGEMPGEQNANLVQLERLRDTLATTNLDLQEAVGRKGFILKQLSGEQPMVVSMTSGEAGSIEEKIKILEFQLSQLLANYTEKHPDIVKIRAEIQKLRQQANASGDQTAATASPQPGDLTTLNPLHQRLKEEYNNINITIGTLETKKKALERKVTEFEKKVTSIPNQEKELAALQRDYNVNEKIYNMLLMKHEEARITKYLELSDEGTHFHVIEPAIVPLTPLKPNPLHFLAIGLVLGGASGIGLIYMKEYLDTSTRGVREAEEVFKIPVLGTIPLVITEGEAQKRKKSRWRWVFGSVSFLVIFAAVVMYILFRQYLYTWMAKVMVG